MAQPTLKSITFATGGIEAEGGNATKVYRHLVMEATAHLDPNGGVHYFTFAGYRWVKKHQDWGRWVPQFWSDDAALNEVRLTARRVAAPAATRTLSGAR